jgi:hypothetical protein
MVCAQNDFHARSTFVTNRATSCVEINTISKIDQNVFPLDPRHVGVPSVCAQNDFLNLWYVGRKRVPILR